MHSSYHSVKYYRHQSRTGKSSAGSNHNSHNKHHINCHHNPSESTRLYSNKRKIVPKATPKFVAPKIDLSYVETVPEDDIDPCHDTVPDSDPGNVPSPIPSPVPSAAATPSPVPSLVPIRECRKID